ncbi:MAG TPA: hypothetical protein VJS92_00445 [Candidatus Polarisedimenticolaceae bacterium]|nr:hypothetical protein [Candidatus Polarisedimenticolaceae bacterium]
MALDVTCPCCSARLKVDAASGEVLASERPKVDASKSFEDAWNNVRSGAQRRQDAFAKAFDRTQHLDELLGKKFDEAKKKAEQDDSKPFNPLDLD